MALVLAGSMLVSFTISAFALFASDRARDQAEIERVSNAAEAWLAERRTTLAGASRDYAQWDDTVEFTEGRAPDYLVNNLNASSFENLGFAAVVIGRPGAPLVAVQRGGKAEAPGELAPLDAGAAAVVLPLLAGSHGGSGLVQVENECWLYASVPITRSDGSGGTGMVWLSFLRLDDALLASPERRLSAEIAFVPRGSTAPAKGFRRELGLEDGFDEWDVVVEAHAHDERAEQGLAAVGANTAGLGLVLLLATAALLDRLVLSRLSLLSDSLASLKSGDAHARLPVAGNDELDRLAHAINELVASDRQLRAEAEREARRDALTGLPNRTSLREHLDLAIRAARSNPHALAALLFIDLDQMKRVNDQLGHAAGDAMLQELARRLAADLPSSDLVARLGGDEFAMVLAGTGTPEAAGARADRVLEVLRRPMDLQSTRLELTASIGISFCRPESDVTTLMKEADTAMYAAKLTGGGRFTVYDRSMHAKVLERLALESALRATIRAGEIAVHLQPIVRLADGELAGYEALARWTDPQRGSIPPLVFIPIAEEGPLIVELDSQVLDRALATFAPLLAERPGLFLTVNNSARRFESPDLVDDVTRALARHGVPGQALLLEVTETQFGRSENGWAERVQRLLDLGVRVSLDDFGAGYSSLGRLRQVPVAMLKLDRSFVVHLSEGAPGLARAIIHLASELSLPVVAEGIETADVAEQLTALDCEYGQGWHFGRPMPAETVAAWQRILPRKG
jgi:diguanylate cyclase (GGDEF)-like protein